MTASDINKVCFDYIHTYYIKIDILRSHAIWNVRMEAHLQVTCLSLFCYPKKGDATFAKMRKF